jgi:hypothetical protein
MAVRLWRHATVSWGMSMYLFGGHRLWHGFSEDNRKENSWRDYGQYPRGGYLDDLWVLNKSKPVKMYLVCFCYLPLLIAERWF